MARLWLANPIRLIGLRRFYHVAAETGYIATQCQPPDRRVRSSGIECAAGFRENAASFQVSEATTGETNIRRPSRAAPEREQSGPRINDAIRAREIRLIDENGDNVGVVSRFDAMEKATQAGLDLVEISPDAEPPVCKIMDFGKFKFEQQKKAAEARKKQKVVEIKEIKMRPAIDDHDYDVKLKAIRRFFEEGDKVKVTLRFRGREMAHQELGMQVLQRVKAEVEGIAKDESEPRLEGRQMVMVLSPR